MNWERLLPRGLQHHLGMRRTNRWLNEVSDAFPRHADAPRHGLPGELIVSLTSHLPRFGSLAINLKSLLDQDVRPNRVVLWIDPRQMGNLPAEVRELTKHGLEILPGDDAIRSFNKIVPALERFPDAFVVTADDDNYYPPDWLRLLIADYDPATPAVACHTAHRAVLSEDRRSLKPFRDWQRSVTDDASLRPSTDLFPMGVMGVLYPPGSLSPLTTDRSLFRTLTPLCDDTWLFFMRVETGFPVRRTAASIHLTELPTGGYKALRDETSAQQRDSQIAAMCKRFGLPISAA